MLAMIDTVMVSQDVPIGKEVCYKCISITELSKQRHIIITSHAAVNCYSRIIIDANRMEGMSKYSKVCTGVEKYTTSGVAIGLDLAAIYKME